MCVYYISSKSVAAEASLPLAFFNVVQLFQKLPVIFWIRDSGSQTCWTHLYVPHRYFFAWNQQHAYKSSCVYSSIHVPMQYIQLKMSFEVPMTGGSQLMLPAAENRKAWGGKFEGSNRCICLLLKADHQQLIYNDPHCWSQWLFFFHLQGLGFQPTV